MGVSACRRLQSIINSVETSDHYSRVEKQSYFPPTPTRLPSRRPILIATIYLLFRGQDTSHHSEGKKKGGVTFKIRFDKLPKLNEGLTV